MDIEIQSLHFTAQPELENFIREKVGKLEKLHHKIISADVILRLENSSDGDNKVCEVKIAIPGNQLIAKRSDQSFESAASQAVDALKQQLESRHK
jgi:putative sigma-54 modulation protein